MRILVVDDNPSIRDLISCSLSYLGRCDTAENGLIAVEMFRQASLEHDPYTLITMDCQMPVLDGFGAISMIRSSENGSKKMPFTSTICVISADDDCLQKYQQKYGVDACLHYLQKPFLLDELYGIASIAQERLQASLPGRRFVRTGSIDLKPDQMVDQANYCNVC